MKTWEMIKELTENPNKEFISKEVGIFAEQKAYGIIDEYGEPTIKIVNMETGNPISSHHINRKWEEVKEPVDFMTAISSGKFIKVEHDLIKPHTYQKYERLDLLMLYLADDYCESDLTEIIQNGKWYIED